MLLSSALQVLLSLFFGTLGTFVLLVKFLEVFLLLGDPHHRLLFFVLDALDYSLPVALSQKLFFLFLLHGPLECLDTILHTIHLQSLKSQIRSPSELYRVFLLKRITNYVITYIGLRFFSLFFS